MEDGHPWGQLAKGTHLLRLRLLHLFQRRLSAALPPHVDGTTSSRMAISVKLFVSPITSPSVTSSSLILVSCNGPSFLLLAAHTITSRGRCQLYQPVVGLSLLCSSISAALDCYLSPPPYNELHQCDYHQLPSPYSELYHYLHCKSHHGCWGSRSNEHR